MVLRILIGVLIVLGPPLIEFFSSPTYKLLGLLGIGVVYVAHQLWLSIPSPVPLTEAEKIRDVVEDFYLAVALRTYYDILRRQGNISLPPVRINVMLKQRNHWFQRPRMRIVYQFCTDQDAPAEREIDFENMKNMGCYTDEERRWLWRMGEGTCGQAAKYKEVTFFDSKKPRYGYPADTLRKRSQEVVKGVNSVISIPIWDKEKDKVIGVLNVDSVYNMEVTRFTNKQVAGIFKGVAEKLAVVLKPLEDGFKP